MSTQPSAPAGAPARGNTPFKVGQPVRIIDRKLIGGVAYVPGNWEFRFVTARGKLKVLNRDNGETRLVNEGWVDPAAERAMSTPSPVAPVAPAKSKSLEEIRGLFEKTVQESAKIRDTTPLGTMEVNGAFHYYTEPDTDTMWIGFALGYRIAERDQAAYLCAAANAYPALVEALAAMLGILEQMDKSDASTGFIASTDRIRIQQARAALALAQKGSPEPSTKEEGR